MRTWVERRRGEWRAGSETGDNIITCRRIAPRDVNAASRNDLHGSWSVGRGLWVMAGKHSAAVSRERCIERIQTKRKEYTGHCDSPAHGRITPGEPKKRPIDLRSALRGPRLSTAAGELGSRAEGASNVKNKMRRREERGSEICLSNTATPDIAALFRLDFHFYLILVYIRSIHLFSSSSTYTQWQNSSSKYTQIKRPR